MVISKLRIPAVVLAASLAFLLAGCHADAGTGDAGGPALHGVDGIEKTTLNVSVLPTIDSAGFFVALHEGLFAQEGLVINYTPATSAGVIGAQARGRYDITGENYVSYIEAQAAHTADLRIIAEGSLLGRGCQVIMTLPNSRITSLAGLRGHVLGVNPDANVGSLLVESALTGEGIAMSAARSARDSVMFPRTPVPFPDAGPALLSHQVDAAVVTEPFASQWAEKYGAVTIADLDVGAADQFPTEGYAVTKAWAKANPNTLKAFQIALEAGQQIADTNRAAVEAAFESLKPGQGHVDRVTAALIALNTYPLSINAVRLQRVADMMRQYGFLKDQFDVQVMLS
jgi:NitT/TauT family transport system substrate-binding protein